MDIEQLKEFYALTTQTMDSIDNVLCSKDDLSEMQAIIDAHTIRVLEITQAANNEKN